nr:MAG TPA: hypothetical protein [Caudoviricetes sp.]
MAQLILVFELFNFFGELIITILSSLIIGLVNSLTDSI